MATRWAVLPRVALADNAVIRLVVLLMLIENVPERALDIEIVLQSVLARIHVRRRDRCENELMTLLSVLAAPENDLMTRVEDRVPKQKHPSGI